jgi:citrate synthase
MSNEDRTATTEMADWWATAISDIHPGVIRLRGYPIEDLIGTVDFVSMIWLMVRGDTPPPGQAALLEAALVASVDHGPQAPSIAIARMATTCGIGLNSAVATGVNVLGDTHGGAGQQCVELLEAIRAAELAGASEHVALRTVVEEWRSRRPYLPGFGHRFHPVDPRRDPLLGLLDDAAERGHIGGEFVRIVRALEAYLNEGRQRPIPMNIDGATATVYAELGFPAELARGLFVLSRSVGILAHAWEQTQRGERIKGPMPRSVLPHYIGPQRPAGAADHILYPDQPVLTG